MGHRLEALVIPKAAVAQAGAELPHTRAIALTPRLNLVPIVGETFDALRERFPKALDSVYSEFCKLAGPIVLVAKRLSHAGAVAYIETDYSGGAGEQSAVVWRAGEVVMPATKGRRGPVNAALRLLGAKAGLNNDEFDALGLGRHRHTDDWLEMAPDPARDVEVRRLRTTDTELFRAVRLAALAEAPDSFGETLEQALKSNWQERAMLGASLADRAVFVAIAGERAVGMVFVSCGKAGEAAFLGGMWVDPLFRQRGIGCALVHEGLGFLRSAGERQLSLWVTSGHDAVLAFYEQLGFRRTGATDALRTGSKVRITELTLSLARSEAAGP